MKSNEIERTKAVTCQPKLTSAAVCVASAHRLVADPSAVDEVLVVQLGAEARRQHLPAQPDEAHAAPPQGHPPPGAVVSHHHLCFNPH